MGAAAKRNPGVFVARLHLFGREAHRIELFRFVPVILAVMGPVDVDSDRSARRNPVTAIFEIAQRAARHGGHRWNEAQRFLERHFGKLELPEIFVSQIAHAAIGIDAPGYGLDLGPQLVLPFGMLGKQPQQRGRAGGDRVMRGHHEEIHMVDHLVDRHQAAILVLCRSKLAEHVLPAAFGAAAMRFPGEIVDQKGAPVDALLHLSKGQRFAHRGDARLHHVDEGTIDPLRLGSPGDADETVCREIEREFLDRGVEAHSALGAIGTPFRHTLGDSPVERARIMPHRPRLECNRQRPAVGPVMVEIHQHQPAREQLVENRPPALLG